MTRSTRVFVVAVVPALIMVSASCGTDDDAAVVTTTQPPVATPVETLPAEPTDPAEPGADLDAAELEQRLDAARSALAQGDFSTMLRVLALSNLAEEIEDRSVTILAPDDAAFEALSADQLADLLADSDRVNEVLSWHVIDEALIWEQLADRSQVTTIRGEVISVETSNGVVAVGGARISELAGTNLEGQEVAVFTIDRVLLAP
jgi:uncharacterized surface protein with fasciclin (FAS1) repeats